MTMKKPSCFKRVECTTCKLSSDCSNYKDNPNHVANVTFTWTNRFDPKGGYKEEHVCKADDLELCDVWGNPIDDTVSVELKCKVCGTTHVKRSRRRY
jgi:hypothetical protein